MQFSAAWHSTGLAFGKSESTSMDLGAKSGND